MNVLVADGQPVFRAGLAERIASAWPEAQIVEAETVEQACIACATRLPDLIVLDLTLPDAVGTEGVARVLRAAPGVPMLVLGFAAEPVSAARLLKMGVAAYVPKDRAGEVLVEALRRVLGGGRYVSPGIADRLADLIGDQQRGPGDAE